MASNLSVQLSELQAKLNEIERRMRTHEALIADLEAENLLLAEENAELKVKLREKAIDEDYLKISHFLADTPDDLVMARRKIAGLIKVVDDCIAIIEHGEI